MPDQNRVCSPGPDDQSVRIAQGVVLRPPPDWTFLPAGDGLLTRRVKAAGPTWQVVERKGRKVFAQGVWAPAARIDAIRAEVDRERQDPAYGKRLQASRARRAQSERTYAEDFTGAVFAFLAFAPVHRELAERMAAAIAAHATPVGSGTVARTRRIPIVERAEAATIAWLRHRTTGYDGMIIPREKGSRREVRRRLAERSRELLQGYREGRVPALGKCKLTTALDS